MRLWEISPKSNMCLRNFSVLIWYVLFLFDNFLCSLSYIKIMVYSWNLCFQYRGKLFPHTQLKFVLSCVWEVCQFISLSGTISNCQRSVSHQSNYFFGLLFIVVTTHVSGGYLLCYGFHCSRISPLTCY